MYYFCTTNRYETYFVKKNSLTAWYLYFVLIKIQQGYSTTILQGPNSQTKKYIYVHTQYIYSQSHSRVAKKESKKKSSSFFTNYALSSSSIVFLCKRQFVMVLFLFSQSFYNISKNRVWISSVYLLKVGTTISCTLTNFSQIFFQKLKLENHQG